MYSKCPGRAAAYSTSLNITPNRVLTSLPCQLLQLYATAIFTLFLLQPVGQAHELDEEKVCSRQSGVV